MNKKWYQVRAMQTTIVGGVITGIFLIISTLLSRTPSNYKKIDNTIKHNNKISEKVDDRKNNTDTLELSNNNLSPDTKLRKLDPLETGKRLDELPNGIYAYIDGINVQYVSPRAAIRASSRGGLPTSFEIQKQNNEIFLIGYIGEESCARIGQIEKLKGLECTLFPRPWKNIQNKVSVPLDSISKVDGRLIDVDDPHSSMIYVLDLFTKKISRLK